MRDGEAEAKDLTMALTRACYLRQISRPVPDTPRLLGEVFASTFTREIVTGAAVAASIKLRDATGDHTHLMLLQRLPACERALAYAASMGDHLQRRMQLAIGWVNAAWANDFETVDALHMTLDGATEDDQHNSIGQVLVAIETAFAAAREGDGHYIFTNTLRSDK